MPNNFLENDGAEVADLNQYWYSDKTISTLVTEIELHATKAAFLSAPSLYFSLTNEKLKSNSKVFEFDKRWEKDPGFVFYDFNKPEKIPVDTWEAFDYVIVDPPFITEEVWSKYAETVKLILAKGGKVLFTSVIENQQMLEAVCDMQLMVPRFRPSIPNLTYQYHCFKNYASEGLEFANDELPAEDPKIVSAMNMANDMRESQQAFAHQVKSRDRTGEQPLPTHGKMQNEDNGEPLKWTTVPEGWTEYANGADGPPPEEAPIDYGPEFAAVEQTRNNLETFKKGIDSLTKFSDSLLKGQEAIAKFADNEEKKVAAQAEYDENVAKRKELLDTMRGIYTEVKTAGKLSSTVVNSMDECIADFETVAIEKQKLKELSADATRKYKSPIFNRQKELLQEMKKIKLDHKKKLAAEAAGEEKQE